jgi:phytoene synthase
VAGAVGVLSLAIFADADPRLDADARTALAETLGEGLQLTNILRDLRDDAARGRLYLPAEGLAAAGIATRDPAAVVDHPDLPAVCRPLAAQARAHLDRARGLLRRAQPRTRRPCRLMLEAYAAQLRRIEAAGYPPPAARVRLSKPAKLWIALRYSLL